MVKRRILFFYGVFFSGLVLNGFSPVYATDTDKKIKCDSSKTKTKKKKLSDWAGTNAQIGLVINTGNSNNTNFSGGVTGVYTHDPWSNNAQANMQLNRSLGQITKERYYAADQLQYNFSENSNNFVYGNANYTRDLFSPYEFQVISSVGYGRDLIRTNRFILTAQAGPGVRYDNVRYRMENERNFIIYTASNITWKVSRSVNFTEQMQYTFGHPYDYLQSVTAITNKITGNIAMQVSYTLQYYSNIPFGSQNTQNVDTITNVALVYNF